MAVFSILLYSIAGTFIGCIFSLIPALHIYNVAGLILLIWLSFPNVIPAASFLPFMMSLVVSFSIINTVPSMYLGAPDESAVFVVLPGQKYMMQGRAHEGVLLTGIGGLLGVVILAFLTPFTFYITPHIKKIISPHLFWLIGLIITYMLMSEWPKSTGRPKTAWGKFTEAWSNLGAGLLTFFLSGILGFIILNKTLVPLEIAFQGIMPAFVGLYAIPMILQNILSSQPVPEQFIADSIDVNTKLIAKGSFAGTIGGYFAAFFPLVTGGIGGLIAGHATAYRDDRIFVISQGVSKTIYYVGAFLLFFVPSMHLARGGMAAIVKPFFTPQTIQDYWTIVGVILLSGAMSFLILVKFSELMSKLITKIDYQTISWIVLFIVCFIVLYLTGIMGIFIMIVSTGIGLIPVFYHSRRMNCMGVLLLPICLSMGDIAPYILKLMGLV